MAAAADHPIVTVETSVGNLVLELAPEAAPVTVENFLKYVQAGFYAGVLFHRVIPGFVAQAGGYTVDGARKPPLHPPIPLESSPLRHDDGALGMARLPEPDTATSEWYLSDGTQRELDRNYCVFGRLADGRDTLGRILSTPTRANDWPAEPIVIIRAYVGKPDPANPTKRYALPTASAPDPSADIVRAAARKLKGRAALLRARRPTMAFADVEAAIGRAERSGSRADLEAAEKLLAAKEKR